MARVTLDIAFKSLHGKVGDAVFYERYGKQLMRPCVVPSNPDTPARRARRGAFREAVHAWQARAIEEGEEWNRAARRSRRSGYNFFISCYLGRAATTSDGRSGMVRIEGSNKRRILLYAPGNGRSCSAHLPVSTVSTPYYAGDRLLPPYRTRIFRR